MSEAPHLPDPNDDPTAHSGNVDPASAEQESLPELQQLPLLHEPYEARVQEPPTPEELSEFHSLLADISQNADYRHNIKNNLVASPTQAAATEAANKFWAGKRGQDEDYPSRRDEIVGRMAYFLQRHPDFKNIALASRKEDEKQLGVEQQRHVLATTIANVGKQRLTQAATEAPGYKSADDLTKRADPDKPNDKVAPEPDDHRFLGAGPKFKTVRRMPKFTHSVLKVQTTFDEKKGREVPVRPYRTPASHLQATREFYGENPRAFNNSFVGNIEKQHKDWLAAKKAHDEDPTNKDKPDPGPWSPQTPARPRSEGFSRESAETGLAADRIILAHLRAEAAWAEGAVSKAENRISTLAEVLVLAEEKNEEESRKPIQDLENKWNTTPEEQIQKLYYAAHDSFGTYRMHGQLSPEYAINHINALNETVIQLKDIDDVVQNSELSAPVYNELIRKRAELADQLVRSRYRYHMTAKASGIDANTSYTKEKGLDLNDDSDIIIYEDGSYAYVGQYAIVADRRNADGTPHDTPFEPDIADIPIEEGLTLDELQARQESILVAWFENQSDWNLRDEVLAYTDELAAAFEQKAETSADPEDIRSAHILRYWSDFIAKRHDVTDEDEVQLWQDGRVIKYDQYYGIDGWWHAFSDGSTLLVKKNSDGSTELLRHFDAYGNELPLNN